MDMREQFGKYLLLKKLTEDPMGETFRAGLLGSKGMERVALLRIFNGQGLDGNRLWQTVESRAAIQEALKSPNIGEGIEMGQLEGIPYVAYDYVSGKNMAKLLEQAAKKRNFVPAEHALLITERLALALASAAETRFGGDRIHHGFLVPHLTIISNEGETRLLGFEYGPGLRSFGQNPVIRQHFGRYLAPEALAGAAPHPVDDIYSLGVILYELLTGRPLPPPAQDGFASVVDQGVVATEGTPIPPEIATLLKQSLVPRDHRVKDVATWHKTLNTYMFEGQYNPTTFNLAFFMHNLFRQEIERESQEIEIEKTLPLPVVQEKKEATAAGVAPPVPVAAAPPAQAAPPGETTRAGEKTENFIPEYAKEDSKSKSGLIIGVIAAVLVAAAAVAFFMKGGQGAPEPMPAATPPVEVPAEPEYAGPSEEELKAQIAELVNQQSDLIQQQYEEKLSGLEEQLAKAQREEQARRDREAQAERDRIAAEEAAAKAVEDERLAVEAATAKKAEEEAAAKKVEEEKAAAEAAAEAAKIAEAEAAAAKKPAAPPKPQVRRGDLVEQGPGVVLPVATRKANPRYPDMAKRFNKNQATVVVKVLIDENGKVLKAELSGKPQKFGFDTEAVQAAKRSQWRPATKNGVPVKIWHTLSIEFRQ